MINIESLYLEYSNQFNISIEKLAIEDGAIFSIIGPNGAGKTTLLNIIGMFDKPKRGRIEISGRDIFKEKNRLSIRREMSFVFSQPYLLNQSVFHNILLPLKLRGINKTKDIDTLLSFFKIEHLKNKNAHKISQGEKHRVALARAFVTNPKILLLDEPFLSLDKRYKESLMDDLKKAIAENNTTVIFVTQEQSESLRLSDKIAVMKNGRILQTDTPQNIFTKPASAEIADFVGIETIIEGIITKKEDNLCSVEINPVRKGEVLDPTLPIKNFYLPSSQLIQEAGLSNGVKDKIVEAISEYDVGQKVFVCIRPEDVIMSHKLDTTSARNHFKAKIIEVEPWGLEYKIILDCGFPLTAFVTKQSIENLELQKHHEVFVYFKATAIHLIRR